MDKFDSEAEVKKRIEIAKKDYWDRKGQKEPKKSVMVITCNKCGCSGGTFAYNYDKTGMIHIGCPAKELDNG